MVNYSPFIGDFLNIFAVCHKKIKALLFKPTPKFIDVYKYRNRAVVYLFVIGTLLCRPHATKTAMNSIKILKPISFASPLEI